MACRVWLPGCLRGGNLGGGMKLFFFHHYLKIPILTDIFQMGSNHQLEIHALGGFLGV